MSKRNILLVLLAVALPVGGYLAYRYWQISRGQEDLSGPTGSIPAGAETLEPISKGPADWPCWRGSRYDGKSVTTGIRTDWSGGLRKLWEIRYLCQGKRAATWSAPVVQGNRLVVPGRDAKNDLLFCLDPADGKLLWHRSYPAKADTQHGPGSRATPAIDEDRVYTFGRSGHLTCWRLFDGQQLWQQDVRKAGGEMPTWGYASSPLVHGDHVIVQAGGSALTIAYDKMTGREAWRAMEGDAGYAAPVPVRVGDVTVLLIFHGNGLAGLNAGDGRTLWDAPWRTTYDVNATTPVFAGTRVFITSDYDYGGELLQLSESGYEVLWRNEAIASHHSDPFILGEYIYGYSGKSDQNRGDFKCLALDTGAEQWSTGEIGWGTTVYVDGHLICLDIKGNLFLIEPDPTGLKIVTKFPKAIPYVHDSNKGHAWTIPVIANGKLYLRYRQALICYDLVNE